MIIYLFFNCIKMAKLGGGGKGKRGRGTSHNIYLQIVRNRIDRGNNNGMVSVTDWIFLFCFVFSRKRCYADPMEPEMECLCIYC